MAISRHEMIERKIREEDDIVKAVGTSYYRWVQHVFGDATRSPAVSTAIFARNFKGEEIIYTLV